MLILPIVNRNRILNIKVELKDADKIKEGVILDDTKESEVVVNGRCFTESSYSKDSEKTSVVDFIRNASVRQKNPYIITTRGASGTDLYDVYSVAYPHKKVHESLENLYADVVTDMRKELPNTTRGRYVSLEDLGVGEYFSDEKIGKLQEVVKEYDQEDWPEQFAKEGILELEDALNFVDMFDCTVINDTTIPEKDIQSMISSLEALSTKDYRNLKSYYNTALANKEVYSKLSKVNYLLHGGAYNLIRNKDKEDAKRLVKKDNHNVR